MTSLLVSKLSTPRVIFNSRPIKVSPYWRLFSLMKATAQTIEDFRIRCVDYQRESDFSICGVIDVRSLWHLCKKHRLKVTI